MEEIFSSYTRLTTVIPAKYNWAAFDVLLVITICTSLIWFLQIIWSRRRLYKCSMEMPGPPGLPIFGSFMYFLGDSYEIFQNISKLFETYPGVFRVWLGPRLFYAVSDPKYFEILFNKCLAKERLNYKADFVVGKGLFTAELSTWKMHRKMIAPTFNPQILDTFVQVFSEQGEVLIGILDNYAGKGEFDVFNVISKYTLDIICETAMGIKVNAQTTDADFTKWTDRVMEIVFLRIFVLWYQNDFIFNLSPLGKESRNIVKGMRDFTGRVVREKKKAYEERKNRSDTDEVPLKRKAFLDYLMEVTNDENVAFTDQELQDEVTTFIIAGSDTSASTSCYAFIMLGLHSNLQDKVYDEIMEVVGPHGRIEGSDLPKLKFLDRFIKETLRLFPAGGILARAVDEDIDLGDCIIPAGVSVALGILRAHTNETYWPDPYKFDPDRFLPEEVAKRHPCAYVPFSYGPRKCIGLQYATMAMKTLIATVVRKYRISTSYQRVKDIKLKAHLVLRPKDGFKISMQRRA
ncbi:cytochrome P450 4C1-like isoform X1 [Diabrotica undecimpunctata]|uniref:cytochrome P450 4C1-like isoform X1 n=1 Tax=Diabrotica undecimpunctata TaxID=50387 RepID=UPI003B632873